MSVICQLTCTATHPVDKKAGARVVGLISCHVSDFAACCWGHGRPCSLFDVEPRRGGLDDRWLGWMGWLMCGLQNKNGSSSCSLLSLLQKQAVPQIEVQPRCPGPQGVFETCCVASLTKCRSAFLIWAANGRRWTSFRSAATWCRTSSSSCRARRWRRRASVRTSM